MYKKILITIGFAVIVCLSFQLLNSQDYKGSGYWQGIEMETKLSNSEKAWIKQKQTIILGVTDNSLPLISFESEQPEGLLVDYLKVISDTIGLDFSFHQILAKDIAASLESGLVDGVITMQDPNLENIAAFTTPLLPLKGSVFLSKSVQIEKETDLKDKKLLLVKEEIPSQSFLSIVSDGCIRQEVSSLTQGVSLLSTGDYDGIIGNEMSLLSLLKGAGLSDEYAMLPNYFYEKNLTIGIPLGSPLYDILNQSVYYLDKSRLVLDLQAKWFGFSHPLQMQSPFKNLGIMLFIVFSGVLCIFFLFYGSNKSLYDELADRMEQVSSSRNELQTTFDGVSYYMAELDQGGLIVNINRAFELYLNIKRRDARGHDICSLLLLNEELSSQFKHAMQEVFSLEADQEMEIHIGRKILEIRLFPIKNAREQVVKVLLMAIDVTNARSAERQMIQDNKMIAVGQLAAGVAHEIRNPLGLIRNYCFLLKTQTKENPAMQEKAVAVIEKAVDRCGKIIDNLLNFSRNSNNKKESIDLYHQILSIISLQKKTLSEKGITLQPVCPEGIIVYIVPESLEMILINLISNAGDAMKNGGVIQILCTQEKENVRIEVKDTGTGISAQVIDEIFHPFFTTKDKTEGNGLGLYLVYNEVQKMNGSISVESQPDAGTTFMITFPKNSEV